MTARKLGLKPSRDKDCDENQHNNNFHKLNEYRSSHQVQAHLFGQHLCPVNIENLPRRSLRPYRALLPNIHGCYQVLPGSHRPWLLFLAYNTHRRLTSREPRLFQISLFAFSEGTSPDNASKEAACFDPAKPGTCFFSFRMVFCINQMFLCHLKCYKNLFHLKCYHQKRLQTCVYGFRICI